MILHACILLVTADTHAAGFTERLFDAMAEYAEPADAMVVAGDLVDHPAQWDSSWARKMDQYLIRAVPGNHDDAEGFSAHAQMPKGVCGDEEDPTFVWFGIDSEQVLGSYGPGFRWALENYPDTPWVVITHRPVVSCTGHRGLEDRAWGIQLVDALPFGSLVVAGHEHVWCQAHMEGWTQIIVSTGGGKRYRCAGDLPENIGCSYLPDDPTFVKVDLAHDDLTVVDVGEQLTESHRSILEGDGAWETEL